MLCLNVEGNEMLWVTTILRMPLSMAASGESADYQPVLWHHMLREQTLRWMSEGKWRGIQGGKHRTERWALLLSVHLYPQSLSNYPAEYKTRCISPTYIFSRLNPCLGREGRFTRLAVVSNSTVSRPFDYHPEVILRWAQPRGQWS